MGLGSSNKGNCDFAELLFLPLYRDGVKSYYPFLPLPSDHLAPSMKEHPLFILLGAEQRVETMPKCRLVSAIEDTRSLQDNSHHESSAVKACKGCGFGISPLQPKERGAHQHLSWQTLLQTTVRCQRQCLQIQSQVHIYAIAPTSHSAVCCHPPPNQSCFVPVLFCSFFCSLPACSFSNS